MIDPIDASAAVFGVVVSAGFTVYCWKLVSYYSLQSLMGKAWVHMFIAGIILTVISAVSSAQTLQIIQLPVWWRNASADIYRVYLLIAVIVIFQAWMNVGKTISHKARDHIT